MLVFLLKAKAEYTVNSYLDYWAPSLRPDVAVRTYESLGVKGNLPAGTYIFCDQERWSRREHQLARDLWKQLAAAGPSHVLLNNPSRTLLRFELLRRLYGRGSNLFAVHRPAAALLRTTFPAFLHSTNHHEGALSPLLMNRLQLVRWLFRRVRPRRWGKLLVEEFCDVSCDGRFAKYSSFNFGGVIVPRHVFHGKNWCLKDTEILDADLLQVYASYLETNPHAVETSEIFRFAGIDYGRVDYAFKDGRVQVWEINTNPMIIGFSATIQDMEKSLALRSNEMIQPHLRRLAELHTEGPEVQYHLREEFPGVIRKPWHLRSRLFSRI